MFALNTIHPTRRPVLVVFPKYNDPILKRKVYSPRHPIHRVYRGVKHLYIAVVQVGTEVRCKVGISSNVEKRVHDLQAANAFHVELYKVYNSYDVAKHLPSKNGQRGSPRELAREVETIVKKKFNKKTAHNNSTEWYNTRPKELEAFIDKEMNLRLNTAIPYGMGDNREWKEYCNNCLRLQLFGKIGSSA